MLPFKCLWFQARLFTWNYLPYSNFLSGKLKIMQFILLYIQKHYGSEKIIPTFLRDKLFNYLLLY
jgi:hypothetical protein